MATKSTRIVEWKEQRRWRALELKHDGWTQEEIAEALGVTKGAVSQWMKCVREQGEEGLQARPRKGATPKLAPEQKHLLPEYLSHGAVAYGFRGEVWTAARVARVIQLEFGVSYHKHHVPKLLKELDWTPQKPLEQARQRDEQQIAQWRSEVWRDLKKKRGVMVVPLSLLMNPAFICCPVWSRLMPRAGKHRACSRFSRATTCR